MLWALELGFHFTVASEALGRGVAAKSSFETLPLYYSLQPMSTEGE